MVRRQSKPGAKTRVAAGKEPGRREEAAGFQGLWVRNDRISVPASGNTWENIRLGRRRSTYPVPKRRKESVGRGKRRRRRWRFNCRREKVLIGHVEK